MSARRLSATAEKLEELVREERQLSAEIEQRDRKRTRIRQLVENVRLVLNGQQALPIEGLEPQAKVPRPAKAIKVSSLQREVLEAASKGPYAPASPDWKRSATSLENAGLVEIGKGDRVTLTPAGNDLLAELKRGGAS